MREDLRIVARIADERDTRKFVRAGADRVVNPYDIGAVPHGGHRLPPADVAEFLDEVVHADEHDVDIQEVTVAAAARRPTAPSIGAVCRAVVTGREVVAGGYAFGPPAVPAAGRGRGGIVAGSAEQVGRARGRGRAPGSRGLAARPDRGPAAERGAATATWPSGLRRRHLGAVLGQRLGQVGVVDGEHLDDEQRGVHRRRRWRRSPPGCPCGICTVE